MLPPPALPLAGQAGVAQNAWVGSTVFRLSGRDWPRYLVGCSRDPLSTTPFQLFTVPGGATALRGRARGALPLRRGGGSLPGADHGGRELQAQRLGPL